MLLPKYSPKYGPVYKALDSIQKEYFQTTNKTKFADGKRQFFALFIIAALTSSYFAWFFVQNMVLLISLGLLMGLFIAYLATIMHEVTHQCFSEKKAVNKSILWTINLIGYNTEFYQKKHSLHHNFTNIEEADGDTDFGVLMKLTPSQKKYFWHNFQWIYNPLLLYPLASFMLIFEISSILDAKKINKKIFFTLGKLSHIFFLIVLPIIFVGFASWFFTYLVLMLTAGIVLSAINQPVHFFKGTEFDKVDQNGQISKEWAVQMILTSTGYQTNNKLVGFLTSGMNNHMLHSLFPRISSRHYPYLASKIESEIEKQGYKAHKFSSLFTLYLSHIHFLRNASKQNAFATLR